MKISVIIPAYNAAATIGKCLLALEKQVYKPTEIIIVDDGSKDGMGEEALKLKSKSQLKIIFLRQNHKGVSGARNLGAKKASGEILAFIDSDCIPGINWLKNINKAFSNPEVGAVGGSYSSGIDDSFWQLFCNEELSFRRRKRRGAVKTLLSNNMACRKNLFWQAGGFPKQYPVCEDMLLSYKLSGLSKIRWLKNNGVRHHYKNSLKDFLRHQFFFGEQSTFFFLKNPEVLASSNHQGRQLYLAILFSFASLICFLMTAYSWGVNNLTGFRVTLTGTGIFLSLHIFLYTGFLIYLYKKKLSKLDLIRAYFVSYSRDLVAGFSFFSGMALYIKKRKP